MIRSFTLVCGLAAATTLSAQAGSYQLSASHEFGAVGQTVDVSLTLDNPAAAEGFSFGITYDDTVLTLTGASEGLVPAATNGGTGADFFYVDMSPVRPAGISAGAVIGCLISLAPPLDTIPVGSGNEIAVAHFGILAGNSPGVSAAVEFTGQLGLPPVQMVVSVNGSPITPAVLAGSVTVQAFSAPQLRRGDCNDDGAQNLADAIALLATLFPNGSPFMPPCLDACDANDDGSMNLSDVIAILASQFGSPIVPLPAPSTSCGADTTPSALDCASPNACP
ncbi:MAG: hypothetical protein AB7O52_08475 [Planctomycetota bacterium]